MEGDSTQHLALVIPEGVHNHPSWVYLSERVDDIVLLQSVYEAAGINLIKPKALKTISTMQAILGLDETFESRAPIYARSAKLRQAVRKIKAQKNPDGMGWKGTYILVYSHLI